MRLTESKLRRVIRQETRKVLNEKKKKVRIKLDRQFKKADWYSIVQPLLDGWPGAGPHKEVIDNIKRGRKVSRDDFNLVTGELSSATWSFWNDVLKNWLGMRPAEGGLACSENMSEEACAQATLLAQELANYAVYTGSDALYNKRSIPYAKQFLAYYGLKTHDDTGLQATPAYNKYRRVFAS